LMLFVPVAELRGGWRQWRAPAAALAAVAVLTGLWWHRVSSLVTATNDLGEPDVQRIFLRQHPFAAVLALLRGTTYAGYDFLHRGVYVIGLNDLLPHQGAAAVLTLCLLAIVLWAPGPVAESWCGRALLAVSVAAPLLGVSLAEYLIWTPPGGATVFGVMPRYWFAAMPPGLLLLESCLPWRALNRKMAGVACVAMALVACTLPWMVAHAFYREGVWHVLRLSLR